MHYGPYTSQKNASLRKKEEHAKTPNNQWRLANVLMALQEDDEDSVK